MQFDLILDGQVLEKPEIEQSYIFIPCIMKYLIM